jgi:hypothetical protein
MVADRMAREKDETNRAGAYRPLGTMVRELAVDLAKARAKPRTVGTALVRADTAIKSSAKSVKRVAGGPGFEPRLTESESW